MAINGQLQESLMNYFMYLIVLQHTPGVDGCLTQTTAFFLKQKTAMNNFIQSKCVEHFEVFSNSYTDFFPPGQLVVNQQSSFSSFNSKEFTESKDFVVIFKMQKFQNGILPILQIFVVSIKFI